jgi:hypothetical protein
VAVQKFVSDPAERSYELRNRDTSENESAPKGLTSSVFIVGSGYCAFAIVRQYRYDRE